MLGTLVRYTRQVRRPALAALALSALMLPPLTAPASARGPDGIADVAERVIDAVVNISTSQNVASRNQGGGGAAPNLPNDPQLDELFRDFFNRRGQQGDNQNRGGNTPRRVNSLGSGFIIDSAGIVSARNRDINSGPYDNYIQTDAAINRGNSGGPLFNLDGEVVGINTAIISPSGGSIGIGFAVPSKTALAVIDQLKNFGETRRGWLGVRIQQVTDEIAESLGIKPARGALVAGVDEKGPAKPAGIEPGDVIVKFDGQDIKEMRDLPRVVADTPVGKDVQVQVIR